MYRLALPLLAAVLLILGVALSAPSPASGKSSGANPGFAGNLVDGGEVRACNVCHSSYELGDGDGSVMIVADESVAAGGSLPITLTLDNQTPPAAPGSGRQGFEATVRDAVTGESWGRLVLTDVANTKYAGDGAFQDTTYVTHTLGGTAQSTWTFSWEPGLDRSGTARVFVAGNAADGNGTSSGDYVYLATADISVAPVAADAAPRLGFGVGTPRPNPTRAGRVARLGVEMVHSGEVTVAVLDGLGRAVRAVERHTLTSGASEVQVRTAGLAAGLYFVRVEGPGGSRTQPLAVVR